jgi:hypothetical protein
MKYRIYLPSFYGHTICAKIEYQTSSGHRISMSPLDEPGNFLIIYSPYPTRFSKQKLNKKGNTKTVHIQHYTGRTVSARCLDTLLDAPRFTGCELMTDDPGKHKHIRDCIQPS